MQPVIVRNCYFATGFFVLHTDRHKSTNREIGVCTAPSCPLYRGLDAAGRPGGPQGSAAGGGVKRPQRLGRHLPLHKRSAGQRPSANPVAASLQLLRSDGKTACRYNPQSASLTAPCRGGTRGAQHHFKSSAKRIPPLSIVNCQLSIVNSKPNPNFLTC